MPDPEKRMDEMISVLKKRGYRLTPQRIAVLRILSESRSHPDIESVYHSVARDFPTTSLATIYKTVSLLKQEGQVLELAFSDAASRYDGNRPIPHPHVICTGCGKIVDEKDEGGERLSKLMAERTGFLIQGHRLDFFGLCPDCRKN